MKKALMLVLGLCLCAGSLWAGASRPLDAQLNAALERASFQARSQQNRWEGEYKGFNPHLTEAQMKEIPVLVAKGKKYLEGSHSGQMFVAGVYYYTDGRAKPSIYKELSFEEKNLYVKHALDYAFYKLFGTDPDVRFVSSETYIATNYPEVKDWHTFHVLCQMYMDLFYETLKDVEKCIIKNDQEGFKEIMLNIW